MPYKILRKRTYFSDLDENVTNKRRCNSVEVKEPHREKTANTLSPSPPLSNEKMSPEEFSSKRYPSL